MKSNFTYFLVTNGERYRIRYQSDDVQGIYFYKTVKFGCFFPDPWETRFLWRASWKLKSLRKAEAKRRAKRDAIWEELLEENI